MFLVTGGAGFIGSNLVAGLADQGLGPIAVCDELGSGDKWKNLAKHPIADIVPPEAIDDWLEARAESLQGIFHLGAISSTTETDADLIIDTNFALTMSLWDWAIEAGVPFIYASSAATYGDGGLGFADDPTIEAHRALRPLNPYGWSKQLADVEILRRAGLGEAPPCWAGLKFFNVYGPNEYHKGGQRSVVHQLFEQVRDKGEVNLFKSHHPDYDDGGQMRDFVWVGDCVDHMIWLSQKAGTAGIFNSGSGKARSFLDLAKASFAAMGTEERIGFIDTPENIRRHYQYFTEARMDRLRDAGYQGQATMLEDGVACYVKDYLATDDPYR